MSLRKPIAILVHRLSAPIIAWPGCEDCVPEELATRARLARLVSHEETATNEECLIYMHTVSLVSPLDQTWYNIYTFIFSQLFPKQAKKIGVYRDQLDSFEQQHLKGLKDWIWRKQVEALKQRKAAVQVQTKSLVLNGGMSIEERKATKKA
jgi:hypothetical protein